MRPSLVLSLAGGARRAAPQGAASATAGTPAAGAAAAAAADDEGAHGTTAAGTAALARSFHDAFELTVSVSVCHPNIVQVLTFFTGEERAGGGARAEVGLGWGGQIICRHTR